MSEGDQGATLTADKYNRLQRLLIQKLNRHDPALAQKLADEAGDVFSGRQGVMIEEHLRQANDLIQKGGIGGGCKVRRDGDGRGIQGKRYTHLPVQFLRRLRAKDPKAADDLFLKALSRLTRQPELTVNDLLVIGNYIFTNPLAPQGPSASSHVFISPISVGDTNLMADTSVDRPDLPPPTARAYVNVATEILGQPSSDTAVGKLRAAAENALDRLQRHARQYSKCATGLPHA